MSDEYMEPDLGRGRQRFKRELTYEIPQPEVAIPLSRWEVTYRINYIEPVVLTKVIEYDNVGFPSNEYLHGEILLVYKTFQDNPRMIQIEKVQRVETSTS